MSHFELFSCKSLRISPFFDDAELVTSVFKEKFGTLGVLKSKLAFCPRIIGVLVFLWNSGGEVNGPQLSLNKGDPDSSEVKGGVPSMDFWSADISE